MGASKWPPKPPRRSGHPGGAGAPLDHRFSIGGQIGGAARRRAAPRPLLAWRGTDARRLSEQIDGAGPEAGRPAITPRVAWHRGASLARADRRGGPEAGRPAITPRVAWAP